MSGRATRRARAEARRARLRRQRRRRRLGISAAVAVGAGLVVAALAVAGRGAGPGNRSAFPTATASGPVTVVDSPVEPGSRFPEFRVRDVEGRTITREKLGGKPALLWFTTSYCVPCQVGAVAVSGLDDRLGGDAFNVLVLFVDPGERVSDLVAWKDRFANPDWMVALDTGLASTVRLQFLDTKYLLDSRGVVRDVDVNVADDRFLALVRRVVASP